MTCSITSADRLIRDRCHHAVFFGFVYAFAGTGVVPAVLQGASRRLHHAQRVHPDRAELGRHQVSRATCSAAASSRAGPTTWAVLERNPNGTPGRQPARGERSRAGSREPPISGRVRRSCSRTPRHLSPTGDARGVNPTPDLVTTSGSG